eukprot:13133754-Alexandrium_andersonii.AAC.1
MTDVFEASSVEGWTQKMLGPDNTAVRLRWMFADALRKSPFCVPEAKTPLSDLWTHSVDCLGKMRAVMQQRTAESAGVPLSATVPRYIDAVGKGNRVG